MQIVAFAGLAQSGKTTTANILAKWLYENNYANPAIRSFAGPLKWASTALGASKEDRPELYRKFCQFVGTELRNPDYCPPYTGPNYWLDLMKDEVGRLMDAERKRLDEGGLETVLIIDDVRFDNEVQLVKEMGGTTVFVNAVSRGVCPPQEGVDPEWRFHDSEMLAINYHNDKLPRKYFDYMLMARSEDSVRNQINHRYGRLWTGGILKGDV